MAQMSVVFSVAIMLVSRKLLFSLLFMNCGTNAEHMVEIFAYIGSDAQVSCSYPAGYESYEKYLCTENCATNDVLVTTTIGRKNRYFISDDTQRQIFTVTISNVDRSDAGKYWCGVSRAGQDIYTKVEVNVNADECNESAHTVQGYEENSVSISCPYLPAFVNSLKYMCKGSQPSTCLQQALVTTNQKHNQRFTLNETQNKITVDITGVTKQDAGSYLCGIERNNNFDVFSCVELTVTEWCCVTLRDVKGVVGQSVTLQCPYPTEHVSNRKFLCKGESRNTCQTVASSDAPKDKFRLQEDRSSRSFSVTITGLGAADVGTYWCGSDSQWTPNKYTKIQLSADAVIPHIILVVPAILLIMIVVTSVIIYKYCWRVQGRDAINNAKEEIEVHELYNNLGAVVSSKDINFDPEAGAQQEEVLYGNVINDHIYSNY